MLIFPVEMLVFVAMDALYGELVSPRATFTRVTRVVHMPIMYSIHGHPSAHTFSVLMKYLIFASVLAVVTSVSHSVKNVKKVWRCVYNDDMCLRTVLYGN